MPPEQPPEQPLEEPPPRHQTKTPTATPRSADLQLSVNGVVRSITAKPVYIPPFQEQAGLGRIAGRKQFSFAQFDQERDAIIEVLVLGDDGQPIDDVAGLIVPPAMITSRSTE